MKKIQTLFVVTVAYTVTRIIVYRIRTKNNPLMGFEFRLLRVVEPKFVFLLN